MNNITRLLPHREINENDVVNFYSLDTATGEAGSLVRISAADLNKDPVELVTRGDSYGYQNTLGHATSLYPQVPHKVTKVTGTGDFFSGALGFLLRDVRTVDENGENLLYYPQKRDELQCVVSGQAVPILTKGTLTFAQTAFINGATVRPAVGDWVVPAANGMLTGIAAANKPTYANFKVGTVLATGHRESQHEADAFTGFFAIVKVEV